jgi:DHA3 family macrolide efflux protein-like MFS transporter|tara:strand:- start:460 stop:1737 length:1278 start_codon:yes stop_codon:yes gene_type:complete
MSKKVYLLWFGQTVSWTGSSMSFFAIGVWIFETTGKASALSTILFTVAIVGVVTGPFGGVLADRFQRKTLIITFDLIIALLMCVIGYLALNEALTLTSLIPFALAFGIFEIAHWTTWSAFLGDVVKKNEVTKVSALFESAEAISVLIGPIGGAFIYSFFGLTGVILVDVITCLFGIATITLFKSKKIETKSNLSIKNIYFDLIEAYNWLKKQKGLLSLVLILSACNFLWGFTQVLIPPMILSFADATGLGIVESSVGLAFLFGSVISLRLADWLQGNLKVAIYCGLLGGLALIIGSVRPSIFLLCVNGVIAGISGTVQYTVSSGAWLAITTEDIRGRALALRGTIAQMLRPLGVVIAGPLGDYLEFSFYPKNVDMLSPLVGTGPGRGYAFLYFLIGVFYVVVWVVNFNNKNLKFLSKQVIEITNN